MSGIGQNYDMEMVHFATIGLIERYGILVIMAE